MEVDGGAAAALDPLAATPTDLERLGEDLEGLVKVAEQAAIDQVLAPYQLDIDLTTIPTLAEQHHLRLG